MRFVVSITLFVWDLLSPLLCLYEICCLHYFVCFSVIVFVPFMWLSCSEGLSVRQCWEVSWIGLLFLLVVVVCGCVCMRQGEWVSVCVCVCLCLCMRYISKVLNLTMEEWSFKNNVWPTQVYVCMCISEGSRQNMGLFIMSDFGIMRFWYVIPQFLKIWITWLAIIWFCEKKGSLVLKPLTNRWRRTGWMHLLITLWRNDFMVLSRFCCLLVA